MNDTVFLTGITGYIARHVALALLEAGYRVRGSTRRAEGADEVRTALAPAVSDPGLLARLDLVTLDLDDDHGWDDAMHGTHALVHTASPFPLAQPKDAQDLIRPAVDGTERALRAARDAGIRRTVLTSSVAAILGRDLATGQTEFREADWSDPEHPSMTPYTVSKTLAERAAWDYVRGEAIDMALTTINPALVIGPPLGDRYGTSLEVVERLLSGKDPMQPRVSFPIVDVRDVAQMHLRALEVPETAGRRYAASAGLLWFREMAQILKTAYPDQKISTMQAPDLMLRLLGLFDPAIRTILPVLGLEQRVSGERARLEMGIDFRDPAESLRDTAAWLTARAAA